MKKVALFFIFFAFALFLVFSNHNKDEREVVQFASWGSQSEVEILKPILKDFETQYPQYRVEFVHIPENYFQKIHLLFASNLAPDVVFMNNLYLPFFANAGMLEELSGNFTKEFESKALEGLSFKGKLYGVPRDISTLVMYINEDIFARNQEKLPKKWTFEKFLETAIYLTQDENYDGKIDTFGIGFEEKPPLYYLSFLMSEGGGILSDNLEYIFDSEASQKGLKFYSDLRNEYHVAPTKAESASVTMAQMFLQGKLAMQISGRWLVPKYSKDAKFNWNVINLPAGEKGSIAPLDTSGWCISKSSKHKKAAKILITFLANHDNIAKFSDSGLIVPARSDVLNNEFLNFQPENLSTKLNNKAFITAIKTGKTTPVSCDYNEIQDKVTDKVNYLFNK